MTKKRIAVIGGGVGAVTAAYAIASDPELRETHEITVYQMGWRLGGKGASGRNLQDGSRIQEHGLHVWAGFYDNAFRLMRSCYEALVKLRLRDADAPLGTLDKAFKPLDYLFLADRVQIGDGPVTWRPWLIDLPGNTLVPGTATEVPTPFGMFLRALAILQDFLANGELAGEAERSLGPGQMAELRGAHGTLHAHAHSLPREPRAHSPGQSSLLTDQIEASQAVVAALQTPENLSNDSVRRLLMIMDLSLAFARGMAASDAFASGYDSLDEWEFSDWLKRNGAGAQALDSVMLRGCYDFVFGFPHGRTLIGDVGAGTAVRAMSRLILTYRGGIFFKMQAGMGDTIFAPYYQVLSALGVKFRFFNAARRLRVSPDGARIAAIEMVEQAAVKGGRYDPLWPVNNLPCWPSEPLWDQLEDADNLKGTDFESEASPPSGRPYTLEAGRDFDTVVLGASLGSLPYLTEELSAASPRWRRMLGSVKTVGTHAAQFWLTKKQDALGWRDLVDTCNPGITQPSGALQTIIDGFDEPLDTWADMTHLLDREAWGVRGPKSIAYFCGPAPEGETLDAFKARVRVWASDDLTKLWTGAENSAHDGFQEDDLYKRPKDPRDAFEAQYYRVNMYGSERYVLSVTGSLYHRLAPDESGFLNLVLAGDWTRCGLNAGCVEAATMSGIAAAAAATGRPMTNVGALDIPSDETPQAKAMYATNSISGAPWPLSGFYARGEMNGWFLFYLMPRAEAQALLPSGMSLAQNRLGAHGMHPVGLSFCRYHAVRGSFLPGFLAMPPYGEASFAIPFVHTEETGRAQFLYPRRLYVDSLPAIAAGRIFYAMNKARAAITQDDASFRATDGQGRPFIDAAFAQHDDPAPLREHPAFGTIASLLNLPFVTRSPTGNLYNAFNLELDRARAAPVSGHISVTDLQEGGFPPAELDAVPLAPGHPHALPGAVRIWCSWSMTNPLDVRRVRQSAMADAWLKRIY